MSLTEDSLEDEEEEQEPAEEESGGRGGGGGGAHRVEEGEQVPEDPEVPEEEECPEDEKEEDEEEPAESEELTGSASRDVCSIANDVYKGLLTHKTDIDITIEPNRLFGAQGSRCLCKQVPDQS